MSTFKRILAVVALILATIGVLLSLVIIWLSWSLNTPITDSLVRIVSGAEQVLATVDTGLTRVDDGLNRVREATATLEETAVSVGETLVDTNLAFALLERTVGDTLFPRLVTARETAGALAETIVSFNETLEAANQLPFIDVPTLTTELEAVADRLAEAQQSVEEIRAEMQAIKEEKVAKPVTFITDRTGPIIERLDAAGERIDTAQTRIADTSSGLATRRERLPRTIDLLSLAVTLVMLWLAAAQGYVFLRAFEFLRGKRVDWNGLFNRGN